MRPTRLDHVAFWVANRDAIVRRCEELLGMHVIDRQERFTLVGTDARHGKLTFFDAEGPRERGPFERLGLRVSDLGAARERLGGLPDTFDLGEGILVRLVEGETASEYDLDHVALLSPNPEAATFEYERLGFTRDGATNRAEVGGAYVELLEGAVETTERPLLNHLAVLVESADEHEAEARREGIGVESVVD